MNRKDKLKETILYLLKNKSMSIDKLECLLYFIDFDYFEKHQFEKHQKPFFKEVKWIKGKEHPELRLKTKKIETPKRRTK